MKSLEDITAAIQKLNIVRHILVDDGRFPNNGKLSLLVYQNAILSPDGKIIEEIFETNSWINSWQNGIYDFDHYHSKAHEVLGVIKGTARVQFGGPSGISVSLSPGDVIIIPAGVAHRLIEGDQDFKVVGAYPDGQQYDMMYGKEGERPQADENIKAVPMPTNDPVYGADGPLLKNWTL